MREREGGRDDCDFRVLVYTSKYNYHFVVSIGQCFALPPHPPDPVVMATLNLNQSAVSRSVEIPSLVHSFLA